MCKFTYAGPSSRQDLDAELPGEEFRGTKRKQAAVTDLQDLMDNDDEDDELDDDSNENLAKDDDVDEEDEDEEGIEAETRLNEREEEDDDSDGQERLLSTLRGLIDQKKAEEAKQGKSMEDMTAHERRQLKIADRARKLEEENMGEKDWHMRGEMRGGKFQSNVWKWCHSQQLSTSVVYNQSKREICKKLRFDPAIVRLVQYTRHTFKIDICSGTYEKISKLARKKISAYWIA